MNEIKIKKSVTLDTLEIVYDVYLNNNLVCNCSNQITLVRKIYLMLKSFTGNHVHIKYKKWWIIDLEEFPVSLSWTKEESLLAFEKVFFNEQSLKSTLKIFFNVFQINYIEC